MKTANLITLTAILIGLVAFLILNNYSPIQRPARPTFDANVQALSNGLIGIDKRRIPKADSRSAGLYDAACAFCHDLPDPASHDVMEWEYVVGRMEELIIELRGREKGVDVPWDGEIKKDVLGYLERHAFGGMNPDELPDRPGKVAKLFKEVCATCHTLPNTSMHSLSVWEYVISKMQNFQKDMGLPVMKDDESAAVLKYLKEIGTHPNKPHNPPLS